MAIRRMAGGTSTGTLPSSAPATSFASRATAGAGNGNPCRDSSFTFQWATPGFAMVTGPAIRRGSYVARTCSAGPRASRGSTRVSSRASTAILASSSSTRSESNPFRTVQSIPPPMSDAISFGVSTTESGPPGTPRDASLAAAARTAPGVGAPTDVSETGGSRVECGPRYLAAVCMIGSRYQYATAATMRMAARQPSRPMTLRQPSMPYSLVHRAALPGGALHEVDAVHGHCLVPDHLFQGLFQPLESPPGRVPPGPAQRDVRPKRTPLRRKTEGSERDLHPMLEQLERGLLQDPGPDHRRAGGVRERAEGVDRDRQDPRARDRLLERLPQLPHPCFIDLT